MKNAPLKSKSTRQSLIITSVLALGALGYTFLVFLPVKNVIANMNLEIQDQQDYIIKSEALVTQIHMISDELAQSREFTRSWEANAPMKSDVSSLFSQIAEISKKAETKLISFDPQNEKPRAFVNEFGVSMSINGSYMEIFDFVKQIEELPVSIWMNELTLSRTSDDGETLRAEMSFTIFGKKSDNSG